MNDEQAQQVLYHVKAAMTYLEAATAEMQHAADVVRVMDTDAAAPPVERVRVTAEPRLRVRSVANAAANIVGRIERGVIVEVLERRDTWGRITEPVAGWIDLSWTEAAPAKG